MAEPENLERRSATVQVISPVRGWQGLELVVDGLKIVAEGTPVTVPADCDCGHGIDAHATEDNPKPNLEATGHKCSGIVYEKVETPGGVKPGASSGCPCEGYDPAHAPREIAFKVERLVDSGPAPGLSARLRRRGPVITAVEPGEDREVATYEPWEDAREFARLLAAAGRAGVTDWTPEIEERFGRYGIEPPEEAGA